MKHFELTPAELQRSFEVKRRMGMRQVPPVTIPTKVPDGYVLVHNNVPHKVDTPNERNGFRARFQKRRGNKLVPSDKLVRCGCDWSGLAHYRLDTIAVRRGGVA